MDPRTEPDEPAAEPTTTIQEAGTTSPEAPEEELAQFTPEYVRKLRSEAAARRREAKEGQERMASMEAELSEMRAWRLERTIADVSGSLGMPSLADPSDLLTYNDATTLVDDEGKADPEKIKSAIAELVERKPHLRAGHGQQGGAWGGSEGGSNPVPPPSLGSLIGKAARGQ